MNCFVYVLAISNNRRISQVGFPGRFRMSRIRLIPALAIICTVLRVADCEGGGTIDDRSNDFDIHKWRVEVDCPIDCSYSLKSRPGVAPQVDVPVIYDHSKNEVSFFTRVCS